MPYVLKAVAPRDEGRYVSGTSDDGLRLFTDSISTAAHMTLDTAVEFIQSSLSMKGDCKLRLVEIKRGPVWVPVEPCACSVCGKDTSCQT